MLVSRAGDTPQTSPLPALLDIEKFAKTPLLHDPYDYLIVPNFLKIDAFDAVMQDYPAISKAGSFSLESLQYGEIFQQLVTELQAEPLRHAVEEKFTVDLTGRPTMVTVRGKCALRNGSIHTDTESKIISALLYMNPLWDDNDGGRLRILRSNNMEDMATEVPPLQGTLIMFRRSASSWHGHKQFVGDRKVVQLNWVTEQKFVERNIKRHIFSSFMKKVFSREGY